MEGGKRGLELLLGDCARGVVLETSPVDGRVARVGAVGEVVVVEVDHIVVVDYAIAVEVEGARGDDDPVDGCDRGAILFERSGGECLEAALLRGCGQLNRVIGGAAGKGERGGAVGDFDGGGLDIGFNAPCGGGLLRDLVQCREGTVPLRLARGRPSEVEFLVALDDVQADLGAGDLNRLLAGDILLRRLVLGEVDDIVLGILRGGDNLRVILLADRVVDARLHLEGGRVDNQRRRVVLVALHIERLVSIVVGEVDDCVAGDDEHPLVVVGCRADVSPEARHVAADTGRAPEVRRVGQEDVLHSEGHREGRERALDGGAALSEDQGRRGGGGADPDIHREGGSRPDSRRQRENENGQDTCCSFHLAMDTSLMKESFSYVI